MVSFRQKYEVDYAVRQLQIRANDVPTKQEARAALFEAAKRHSPSEGREKIMRDALKRVKLRSDLVVGTRMTC